MRTKQKQLIGFFEVRSGKMWVTDPCYDTGTWCQGVLENVANGTWRAEIELSDEGKWGARVSKLIITNTLGEAVGSERGLEAEIGVDSGQAGFFDYGCPIGEGKYGDSDSFYGKCCDLTLGNKMAGVLLNGAVSSSGYGDGGYTCYYWTDNNNQVVKAQIVFIGEDGE